MKRLLPRRARLIDARDPVQQDSPDQTRPTDTDTGPPDSLPDSSFPDGVKVLHDCPDATVDICFVHGLTGDREDTWTAPGQPRPWPATLLPPRLDKARILTYGYDAYVVRKGVVGSNRLFDHATNLLHDLTTDRASCNASSRPLIFVAHSLGGLVCEEAIILSRNNPERHLRGIFECTKGIIFMGTPHKGAWMARWAEIPVRAIGLFKSSSKSLLEILETNNQALKSIQVRFLAMIREQREAGRPLEVTCFFEELPLPMVGTVVSMESATFESYTAISIHADHIDMVRFASAEETGFKRLLGELRRWVSEITAPEAAPQLSQDCLDCLRSLAFPAMHDRSHDIGRAVAGTCDWLLRHKRYRSWVACDRGLLWIKGKPGSGKSTLLKYALDNQAVASGASDNDVVLSFFFHGRGDELQKTPPGFFRSLIHQFLSQAPAALSDLVDEFKQKRDQISEPGQKWQWHEGELRRFFESSLPKVLETRSVWFFVDALDECGRECAVDLFRWFRSVLRTLSTTNAQFRICVTCRHYPILDQNCDFDICPEHENKQDISIYVRDQLSGFPELAESPIRSLITDSASGVFMWARLVVDQVLDLDNDGVPLEEIKQRISLIPPELDELYHELIRGMKEKQVSLKLIQWICFATRPLTLDELRWAMVVDSNCSHQSLRECQKSGSYTPSNDRMKRRIQTLSCGLAEVILLSGDEDWSDSHGNSISVLWSSEGLGVVQFIHQSVKDFFIEKGLLALDSNLSSIDAVIGVAQFQLSRTCIRYLAMEEIGQSTDFRHDSVKSDFSLLDYATTSWVTHTQQTDAKGIPQHDLLELFDWPSNTLVDLWTRTYRAMNRYSDACPPEGTSLLHIVARYQILGPLQTILDKIDQTAIDIEAKDHDGRTPLYWAARNGHETAVRLLLGKDAAIEAKDKANGTPLHCAARNGHETVVQLLLEKGADTEAKDHMRWTALHWAARIGHKAVVRLLLEKGAEIEAQTKNGWTPLQCAVSRGGEAVVRLLLEKGAEIEAQTKNGWTLLHYAASESDKAVVRLLLERGAAIEAQAKNGRTPLHRAVSRGDKAVVRLLLERGAAIEAQTKNGWTPLHRAAWRGHETD